QFEHVADVLFDAQAPEHGRVLRQVRQAHARALVDGHRSDGLIVDFDAAGIGEYTADTRVQAGGLARAVWAERADDFTGVDRQRDVLHHGAAVVDLAQARCAQAALLDAGG